MLSDDISIYNGVHQYVCSLSHFFFSVVTSFRVYTLAFAFPHLFALKIKKPILRDTLGFSHIPSFFVTTFFCILFSHLTFACMDEIGELLFDGEPVLLVYIIFLIIMFWMYIRSLARILLRHEFEFGVVFGRCRIFWLVGSIDWFT